MIEESNFCSSLPTCVFCYTTNSYRVLHDSVDEIDDSNSSSIRKLFNKVIPSTSNPENTDYDGYCTRGTNANICTEYPSLVSSDEGKYYWWIIAFTVPMLVVVGIMILSIRYKI